MGLFIYGGMKWAGGKVRGGSNGVGESEALVEQHTQSKLQKYVKGGLSLASETLLLYIC